MTAPFLGDGLLLKVKPEVSDYSRDFRWLKPRAILPILNEQNGRTEWGASIQSTDVLQSQVYSFQITTLQDQLWYDPKYTNKPSILAFQLVHIESHLFCQYSLPMIHLKALL